MSINQSFTYLHDIAWPMASTGASNAVVETIRKLFAPLRIVVFKQTYVFSKDVAVCQNPGTPSVHLKIAGIYGCSSP